MDSTTTENLFVSGVLNLNATAMATAMAAAAGNESQHLAYALDMGFQAVPTNYSDEVSDFMTDPPSIDMDSDDALTPPLEFLQVNGRALANIIAYSVLFLFAATGNLTIFFSIITNNYNKLFKKAIGSQTTLHQAHHVTGMGSPSRTTHGFGLGRSSSSKSYSKITLLILNLSIADLIVTFFLMPMEIFWRISVKWVGGNVLCKSCQFGRAFGLYLSSMIIICISLDRYLAIMYPLKQMDAQRRIKRMLIVAWIAAAACAAPQSFIFSVKSHPVYTTFEQCVSIGFFTSQEQEILYNVFSLSAMYFLPILVILFTYSMVLFKLARKSNEHRQIGSIVSNSLRNSHRQLGPCLSTSSSTTHSAYTIPSETGNGIGGGDGKQKQNLTLRTSDNGLTTYSRAKTRTLKLTLVIVVTFLLCAVPYIFMTLWYMFDRESAQQIDGRLQDFFFMMVVANSCMNPLIYGSFGKGKLFWWCNICSSRDNQGQEAHNQVQDLPGRKVSASSAGAVAGVIHSTIAHAPVAIISRDFVERRRQEQLHPTLSVTLSSAPMLGTVGREQNWRTHGDADAHARAHAHYYAKKKLTVFALFMRKMGAWLNLTNHYFHDNIVNHHPTTLVAQLSVDLDGVVVPPPPPRTVAPLTRAATVVPLC